MLKYEQATGKLFDANGFLLGVGYSGHGDARNDPDRDSEPRVGPIPRGVYVILEPHDSLTHGPYVLPLKPIYGTDTHGRSGFLIHGDSVHAPGTASEGCVIMPRAVRMTIWQEGDHTVQVIAGPAPLPEPVVTT